MRDYSGNWWGPTLTSWMQSNPFLVNGNTDRDPEIVDGFDSTVWFVNYTSPATAEVSSAPSAAAPAFLLRVSPALTDPLPVAAGLTTFTLTFSRAMNTAIQPSVTFSLGVSPYPTRVVEPALGWVDSQTWQGTFAVQTDTGAGTNTIRVSGATDATGFVIPDDTRNKFAITSGGLGANNGIVIITPRGRELSWTENDKPSDALGYNVMRASQATPFGPYEKINGSLVAGATFTDTTASDNSTYWYIINIVRSGLNAEQWTPPLVHTVPVSLSAFELE